MTSTWRIELSVSDLCEILAPLEAEIIDVTPMLSNRGEEIIAWISQHSVGENYLIIDDEVKEIHSYIDDEQIVYIRNGFTQGGFGPEHLQHALRLTEYWEWQNSV